MHEYFYYSCLIDSVFHKINNLTGKNTYCFVFIILLFTISGCSQSTDKSLVEQLEYSLKNDLLDAWYPRSIDSINGGFLSNFNYKWQAKGPQNKMLVTQARHLWTTSQAALFYNDSLYVKIAKHGFDFLKTHMWDSEFGGFHMFCDSKGNPANKSKSANKTAYGNAFAIYALSVYYSMSGDTSALNLAKRTFNWLEKHSYDPEYKGYFDKLQRNGSLYTNQNSELQGASVKSKQWKDQNSSIHLLEAFTSLYEIWPDTLLNKRLGEMLLLIRDTIAGDKGYLTLFLERDWTPVTYRDSTEAKRKQYYYFDHISFGHDVETAYLLLEASHALGLKDDKRTIAIAKKLVDHALDNGWDNKKGGFFDAGYCFKNEDHVTIINPEKVWWTQAEGLNALLLMTELFPSESRYFEAFQKQWQYIDLYAIDKKQGGWYESGLDTNPEKAKAPKAHDWKINYHNARALMNCITMLKTKRE